MDLRPAEDPQLTRQPLDVEALRRSATTPDAGWRRVDVVAETGSTNADLLARASSGEDIAGAVLLAESQTSGRGRNGRSWSTVRYAQLTLSVGVDASRVASEAWGWLPLAAGIAVVDTVFAVGGVRAGLKWPNDVLARDDGQPDDEQARKLAGILAEVAAPAPAIVLGIGLNVTLRGDEVGESVVTSMAALGASSLDRTALASRLLIELGRRIAEWKTGGGATLAADYSQRSLTIGGHVRAMLPGDRQVVGTAVDVDGQGRLLIDTGAGPIPRVASLLPAGVVSVSAGDVVHLRRS